MADELDEQLLDSIIPGWRQPARTPLEQQLDAAVPQWRQIVSDPGWDAFLAIPNRLTGQTKGQLLDHANATSNVAGMAELIKEYAWRLQMRELDRAAMSGYPAFNGRRSTYTREQIAANYHAHQRGEFAGREADWDALERSMIAAAREGRVANALPLAKNHGDGR